MILFCLLLSTVVLVRLYGREQYQDRIPNGDKVFYDGTLWQCVGRTSRSGGGTTNVFGLAFQDAAYNWTTELCEADSDGDGLTNGFELGDPECVWTVNSTPSRTENITHPGIHQACQASNFTVTLGSGSNLTFMCYMSLTSYAELHWRIVSDKVDLAVRRVGRGIRGFMGLGFLSDGVHMVEAEAMLLTGTTIADYHLGAQNVEGVYLSPETVLNYEERGSANTDSDFVLWITSLSLESLSNVPLLFSTHFMDPFPRKHNDARSYRLNLVEATGVENTPSYLTIDTVKTHGILAICAWCFVAPIGILCKHFLTLWFDDFIIGAWPIGFLAHQFFMVMAIIISITGIFIAWANFSFRATPVHGKLGTSVFAFVMVQPVIAWLFRPDGELFPKARMLFNMVHRGGGILILACAITNIFIGLGQFSELWNDDDAHGVMFTLAISGLLLNVAVGILLQILWLMSPMKGNPEQVSTVPASGIGRQGGPGH